MKSRGIMLIMCFTLIACSDQRDADVEPGNQPTTNASPVAAVDDNDVTPFVLTDVTEASGLQFTMTSGRMPSTQILEVKGGGIGLIDYDNDGDLDVFVPNGATLDDPTNGPGCRLFENEGDLTFRDASVDAGITLRRWAIGVTVADVDNDGFDDLYVTCYGPNALLRNTGDGRFEDVTDSAGVGHPGWSTASSFGDIDADGDLDLYVVNYLEFDVNAPPPKTTFLGTEVFAGPRGLPGASDALYRNRGDGTFEDITAPSGVADVPPSYGLGAIMLDFDRDGRTDIYVGNDSMRNFLFTAQDDGTFRDVGGISGIGSDGGGANQATMGIAIADVDGNGLPDVLTTNFASDTNTLHLNADGRFFDDGTKRYGLGMISRPYLGWACGLYDFDHDGDEDVLILNGHVYPHASMSLMNSDYLQPPLLFERESNRFVRVLPDDARPWLDARHCDRGAAFGDLDGDGDIDVVVTELNGPIRVLRNDGASGAWLMIEPEQPLGCEITVTVGETMLRRWIVSGTSFLSSSEQAAHVAWRTGEDQVRIDVTWPDGETATMHDVSANQRVRVSRPGQSARGR
ncbi:MAG: CRTAC1 family protein [Planctomycetota bacterium]